jgi:hypothetical protein
LKYRNVNVNVVFQHAFSNTDAAGRREAGIEDGSGGICTITTITGLYNKDLSFGFTPTKSLAVIYVVLNILRWTFHRREGVDIDWFIIAMKRFGVSRPSRHSAERIAS